MIPEDQWLLDKLQDMLMERQDLEEMCDEGEELERLQFYIDTLCELKSTIIIIFLCERFLSSKYRHIDKVFIISLINFQNIIQ